MNSNPWQRHLSTVSRLFGLGALALIAGCIILPLPATEVPETVDGQRLDPHALLAKDGAIHPGADRSSVHAALHLPPQYFGDRQHEPYEQYFFRPRAGAFFFLGANPEGGFIGINKRYMNYELTVNYDEHDRVTSCPMTSSEALDAHSPVDGTDR